MEDDDDYLKHHILSCIIYIWTSDFFMLNYEADITSVAE